MMTFEAPSYALKDFGQLQRRTVAKSHHKNLPLRIKCSGFSLDRDFIRKSLRTTQCIFTTLILAMSQAGDHDLRLVPCQGTG